MEADGALTILERDFGVLNARLLGSGKEGFVFTDGRRSYKFFRDGQASLSSDSLAFLRDRLGSNTNLPHRILPVEEVWADGPHLVLVSPLVRGEHYTGGHWWELVELLRECRALGVALTNIHPDNLLVTGGGLVFVDLGVSVEPITEPLWEQMVRRAFLSFRWHGRADLRELMTRSLREDPPELDGVSLLFSDVSGEAPRSRSARLARSPGPVREVTLLIRTCLMEWRTIEFQVRHLVGQLESPHRFREILLVSDMSPGPFTRQYDSPNAAAHQEALVRLLDDGILDRVVVVPRDPETVTATARGWFDLETTNPNSQRGEATHSSLYGFDQSRTDLVLQVDSDCLIGRPDPQYDYLGAMMHELEENVHAVTVSLPVPLVAPQDYTEGNDLRKWRVEVRCALFSRARLARLLPLPNRLVDGQLEFSWHRALDAKLAASTGQSYRGGNPGAYMVHVPNSRKTDRNTWFNIALAVGRGRTNPGQFGKADLVGSAGDWLGRREEDLIFLVRGRDVPLPRLRRCVESLLSQRDQQFGVILVDAGSTNGMPEYLEELSQHELRGRATLYRNWESVSSMENQVTAIRELVARPESIVALLDADDALLGPHVVDRLRDAYRQGADLTVGSMIRTDRATDYTVTLVNPRAHRGGNVWQHLTTFRRRLFDRIHEEDLKVDGKWIPYAEDWAIMLPLVEMASHPIWIREPIYLHDPSWDSRGYSREEREQMIARICQKPSYLPTRSNPESA